MFAHTRHHLDGIVGQDIDLLYLVAPEVVGHDDTAQRSEDVAGKGTADAARSHHQVAHITRVLQRASVLVDIVVVAIGSKHSHHRHALGHPDIDTPVLGLVALGLLYQLLTLQQLLHRTEVDVGHRLPHRIDTSFVEHARDVGSREDAFYHAFLNGDLHAIAHDIPLCRAIEGSHRQEQIDANDDIECDDQYFLPVHHRGLLQVY